MKTMSNKSSTLPIILGLLLLAGVIAGVSWYYQSQALAPQGAPHVTIVIPAPAPVVTPPAPEPAIVAEEPPPAPQFDPNAGPPDFSQFNPNDPAFQQAQQQGIQAMTTAMYGDLFTQMNLSETQQTQVNDLMMQRAQAVGTVFQNLFTQGFDPNVDPAQMQAQMQAQILQAQGPANQALQATLGDANYQQLQARDQQIQSQFGGPGGRGGPGGP